MRNMERTSVLIHVMHISYQDFRTRVLLAILAISVLIIAGIAVLDAIKQEYRRNISGHVISNLETMSRGVVLLQLDSVARVRKIADELVHKELAVRLMKKPDDPSRSDSRSRRTASGVRLSTASRSASPPAGYQHPSVATFGGRDAPKPDSRRDNVGRLP